MNDHDYDEQRDFVRMSIETRVTYKVKNSDGRSHHGISENLSATGLHMSTDFALKEGDVIDLVMKPNSDNFPPFVAEGTVLRTDLVKNDINPFHVAIKLTATS